MPPSNAILKSKRFLPLFITSFLGAFNDNVFKNAFLVYVVFKFTTVYGVKSEVIVSLSAGLFILPYMLLSGFSGQLADRRNKAALTRVIKKVEIVLTLLMIIGFKTSSVTLLLVLLCLMGVQSTFFGPIKYSLLPEHLSEAELLKGNSMMAAGTFISILLGTIYGGFFILADNGFWLIGGMLVTCALAGYTASRFIPDSRINAQDYKLTFVASTKRILGHVFDKRHLVWLIVGISWFWFLGATFLSQFPAFVKSIGQPPELVSVFMAIFTVGIAVGAALCNALLKGEMSPRLMGWATLGIFLSTMHLYYVTEFMTDSLVWLMIDVALIALFGGLFTVPLYALLQHHSESEKGAQNIAANNVMNAVFMVASAIYAAGLLTAGFQVSTVFLGAALASFPVGVFLKNRIEKAVKHS